MPFSSFTEAFPRFHTALAEWGACLLLIYLPGNRLRKELTPWVSALCLVLLVITNQTGEAQHGPSWLFWMGLGLSVMFLLIDLCVVQSYAQSLFCWAHAFLAAEFAASLEWQINYFIQRTILMDAPNPIELSVWSPEAMFFLVICYLVIFGGLRLFLHKRGIHLSGIGWKEAWISVFIAFATFFLSNIQFVFNDVHIRMLFGPDVLYTRTLMDLVGLAILLGYDEMRRKMDLEIELRAMHNVLHQQYDQYLQFERGNEALHRIYHDMNNQIDFIRAEKNEEKREGYLKEMEDTLDLYGNAVQTGYSVLDTLLTSKKMICQHEGIAMSCYAVGECLKSLDVMDLCSIFGNALDNAIRYEKSIENPEDRLISVRVGQEGDYAVILVENYCNDEVTMENGLPVSREDRGVFHGYGAKSIRRAVEKYGGEVRFSREDEWFVMKAVLPARV